MRIVGLHSLLAAASAFLLGMHSAYPQSGAAGPGERPTNILFIGIDDLRPALGAYGDTLAVTPNIDRLAKQAVVFMRAFSQQAICNPSRASLMTGRRPETTRVWGNTRHFRAALPHVVTLPQYLKQHGYETRAVGKIYHDPAWAQDPPSWSDPAQLAVTLDVGGMYARDYLQRRSFKASATERADVPDSLYIDGRVANEAIRVLEAIQHKPFFLAVGFRRPHLPFSAPERYWRLHDGKRFPDPKPASPPLGAPELALHEGIELRGYTDVPQYEPLSRAQVQQLWQGYYVATSYVDAQVGRLLHALERLGLRDRTIVVLWSDHGFHLGEQGLWAKTTNFDLDTRVPLIIRVPGTTDTGGRSEALVELVDLYPTLADLAALPIPNDLEGSSMVPLLRDPRRLWKSAVFSQAFAHVGGSADPNAEPEVLGMSVRTDRFRYTEWTDLQNGLMVARELYDYAQGSVERVNLAADRRYVDVVGEMAGALRAGWQKAVPEARTSRR